jgi:hypothetical protein
MNNMKYFVFLLLPLILGCSSNSGTKSENENDSVTVQNDSLSSASSMDDYDWTPDGFKKDHPDEWAVVKPSINIQQSGDEKCFDKIDVLVNDYLDKKKISLPSDVDKRIQCIAEICRTKFSIDGYDESNVGMNISDGTRRLFEGYINWLYEKEAKTILSNNKLVDLERELELYNSLNDAMYDVCDSVAFCMGGSGGWASSAQIVDLSIDYHRCMYQAIIGSKLEQKKELDVPLDLFDKECQILNGNYKPYEDGQPKDVSHIVNRFKNAFHSWYAYRKSTAKSIKDNKFKKTYESITYSFARIHFRYLKNRYSDIGYVGGIAAEACLKDDCSNQELLNFNYEKSSEELSRKYSQLWDTEDF